MNLNKNILVPRQSQKSNPSGFLEASDPRSFDGTMYASKIIYFNFIMMVCTTGPGSDENLLAKVDS